MLGFGKKAEGPEATNDVAAAQSRAEGQKLEWGPEFDQTTWLDANRNIFELNQKVGEDENKWRLPTRDELLARLKEINLSEFKSYWSNTGCKWADSRNDRNITGDIVHSNGKWVKGTDFMYDVCYVLPVRNVA